MASTTDVAGEPGAEGGDLRARRRFGGPLARTGAALLLVLLLAAVLGVVLALDARTAHASLRAAMPQVSALREQVLAGDAQRASDTAAELALHTATARGAVHGPHWSIARMLPGVGPNVEAAQAATVVVDDLATDVLPDLVAAAAVVDPARLAPTDGRIDLAPVVEAAPSIRAADDAVAAAAARLADVDTTAVHERLQRPLATLRGEIDDLAALTGTAARAVTLLPPMLGDDGPREYLLLVQNNAEVRSTGGHVGAFASLRADDGVLSLQDQRSTAQLWGFPEPVVELTEAELALFGPQLAVYPSNVTSTPDFPRGAEIARQMWWLKTGTELDGVLSVDPVALGSLLAATGPVMLPTGTDLTADNAADIMLNRVYLDIADRAQQDEFFQAAARAIFRHVMSGAGDPVAAVDALAGAAAEGRIMVWSAHRPEQELLGGTVLGGALRGDAGDSPVVGLYLNDFIAAKVGYYQRMDAVVTATECHADGSQELTAAVTLASEMPAGAADLPPSLVGRGDPVPAGQIVTQLFVYAPTGGRVTGVRASDGNTAVLAHVHEDRVVVARAVDLSPGESVVLEFDMTTGPGLPGDVEVDMTPGPGGKKFSSTTIGCEP